MWKKEDSFYKRAKKVGYRSRAAFKLIQINCVFKIMKEGDTVVDLGAAPGGWSQVTKEIVGEKGVVISVDKQRMEEIKGVIFIECDIKKEEEAVNAIKHALNNFANVNVIISDASPKLSGHKNYDHFRSLELSEASLNIAFLLLKEGGNFVTKMFQGDFFKDFQEKMKKKFSFVKVHSPKASRKSSAEVYVIGKGFKSPYKN